MLELFFHRASRVRTLLTSTRPDPRAESFLCGKREKVRVVFVSPEAHLRFARIRETHRYGRCDVYTYLKSQISNLKTKNSNLEVRQVRTTDPEERGAHRETLCDQSGHFAQSNSAYSPSRVRHRPSPKRRGPAQCPNAPRPFKYSNDANLYARYRQRTPRNP